MKILIDIHALQGQKAGKAFYTLNLLRGVSSLPEARKHQFLLLSPKKISLGFNPPPNFKWKTGHPEGFRFHLSILKEIRSQKYDLFWSPTSFIPLVLGKGKIVGTIYDFAVFQKNNFKKNKKATIIEKFLIKKVIKKSAALIAISQNTYNELIEKFPKAKKKSFVILGSPKKYPLRSPPKEVLEKYNLVNKEYLLFVGTLEPRKNIPNTLRAYRLLIDRLRAENKQTPLFVLAGKKGWYFEEISRTIEKLKLKEWVKPLGYIPNQDLPALYKNSKFFIYVPYYEGFGLPVIEAISFGKACLTSDTSSLPEVVGPCGIKVRPNHVQKISEMMYKLLNNTGLRKKYEQKTGEWIKHFSSQKSAKKLLEVFEFVSQGNW